MSTDQPSIGMRSIFHLNINCRDLDETLAFYVRLGFTILHGPTEVGRRLDDSVHRGLGLTELSPSRGALLCLDTKPSSTILDVLEWANRPEGETAYSDVRHIGVARVALIVDDLDLAIANLEAEGIEFVSEAVNTPVYNERWILLRDPNGIYLELFEFVGGPESNYYPAYRAALQES